MYICIRIWQARKRKRTGPGIETRRARPVAERLTCKVHDYRRGSQAGLGPKVSRRMVVATVWLVNGVPGVVVLSFATVMEQTTMMARQGWGMWVIMFMLWLASTTVYFSRPVPIHLRGPDYNEHNIFDFGTWWTLYLYSSSLSVAEWLFIVPLLFSHRNQVIQPKLSLSLSSSPWNQNTPTYVWEDNGCFRVPPEILVMSRRDA